MYLQQLGFLLLLVLICFCIYSRGLWGSSGGPCVAVPHDGVARVSPLAWYFKGRGAEWGGLCREPCGLLAGTWPAAPVPLALPVIPVKVWRLHLWSAVRTMETSVSFLSL